MIKQRFVPPLQGFSSLGKSNSVFKWAGDNKVMVLVFCLAITALVLAILAYTREDFRGKIMELFRSKPKNTIKDLDVLFFMSPTCPWCQKMIKVLENEKTISEVTIVDISRPDGRELAKKFGADGRGVPNFVSRKLNTGTLGFKESTRQIVDDLSSVNDKDSKDSKKEPGGHSHPPSQEPQEVQEQEPVDHQDVASLGIVIFVSEGCGWCKKTKEDAQNLGIMPYLELQDVNSEEGKTFINQSGIDFKGAPTFYSRRTGKTAVGYKPFNQIITMLSE